MGGNEEDSAKLFSVVPGDRTRSSMHKLKDLTFHPSTKKCFFIVRVDRYCNRLPKEVVESPSLETFKTWMDKTLRKLQLALIEHGMGYMISRGPLQTDFHDK